MDKRIDPLVGALERNAQRRPEDPKRGDLGLLSFAVIILSHIAFKLAVVGGVNFYVFTKVNVDINALFGFLGLTEQHNVYLLIVCVLLINLILLASVSLVSGVLQLHISKMIGHDYKKAYFCAFRAATTVITKKRRPFFIANWLVNSRIIQGTIDKLYPNRESD